MSRSPCSLYCARTWSSEVFDLWKIAAGVHCWARTFWIFEFLIEGSSSSQGVNSVGGKEKRGHVLWVLSLQRGKDAAKSETNMSVVSKCFNKVNWDEAPWWLWSLWDTWGTDNENQTLSWAVMFANSHRGSFSFCLSLITKPFNISKNNDHLRKYIQMGVLLLLEHGFA